MSFECPTISTMDKSLDDNSFDGYSRSDLMNYIKVLESKILDPTSKGPISLEDLRSALSKTPCHISQSKEISSSTLHDYLRTEDCSKDPSSVKNGNCSELHKSSPSLSATGTKPILDELSSCDNKQGKTANCFVAYEDNMSSSNESDQDEAMEKVRDQLKQLLKEAKGIKRQLKWNEQERAITAASKCLTGNTSNGEALQPSKSVQDTSSKRNISLLRKESLGESTTPKKRKIRSPGDDDDDASSKKHKRSRKRRDKDQRKKFKK